ncbi:TonB-dependent receptor domain-containing protein [Martelella alba]|uniref:TonB-dependent receptor n=1 Tax=Martelella alba TaxID=2590451 RepID=A0ABY2SIF7_9HYPH|nr:TonB-dependent receptor [Martelella alba]TKI05189.1 TonB-dependent receptor [Martelella alba]
MFTSFPSRRLFTKTVILGTLVSSVVGAGYAAADDLTDDAAQATAAGVSAGEKPPVKAAKKKTAGETITVTAQAPKKAGTQITVTAADMQKKGATDFGSVMRYEPLISATGSSAGSSVGKSGFDRSGYTGYNIRGLESNRVSIDVDGIEQPDATGRPYVSRAGLDTFGIGRDYIDPYMYGKVDIQAGATATDHANTAIGGAVSFIPKSADDDLYPGKKTYFGYQSDYDSANRGWHNGITAAAGDETLRGLVAISRRDGQETRNNSGTHDAYPENWHSNAIMTSGIWQPNDVHKLTGTLDYYEKVYHTHYDSWNSSGSAILGTARQQSNTRRWGLSLQDEWTPYNDYIDTLTTKIYYQKTQAHDSTYMPDSTTGDMETVFSDYDVKTYGFETRLTKTLGRHALSAGLNARQSDTERPFRQDPTPSTYSVIMQPESDSRSYVLGGFVQDTIGFDMGGHAFSVVPGVRVASQHAEARNFSSLASGSTVLTADEVQSLYGKDFSDTQVLPSLSFLYNLTPDLMTYLQYKRGAQFPNASQLYGSWNLGSSYAGTSQYALIGNSDLKTETSNNVEWGMKGKVTDGVTFHTSLFYNTYDNFIAYTRYTRASNPEQFTNVPSNIYIAYKAENRDKAYIYGGDISTKITFGTWYPSVNGLSATFALGYAQGAAKSDYLGDKYIDLDSVPPMKAVVGVAWDDPSQRYGAALTATFVKGKRADATSRESYTNTGSAITDSATQYMRVPGYGLLDMTAYWRVAPHVKLSGGIYNITDRKYWDYLSSRQITESTNQDAYNKALAVMPGRTFQLGVNVDF